MALDQRISFIGGGNMASALVSGLLAAGSVRPERVTVSDVRAEALDTLRERHGVATTQDNARACQSEILVLSVKPQVFPALLTELAPHIDGSKLVISIAAGVPLSAIEARLGASTRVVRAMPNTPALVGAGATAIAAGAHASADDLQVAAQIFASTGISVTVTEDQMDAVTALSGSGPAYVFLLVEAMVDAATQLGLPHDAATLLATQTVFGAGKLLANSGEAAAELRRKVTSPGGTTQAGIAAMEAGLRGALTAGLHAARDRGQELGRAARESLRSG
jgi:pyrroline-5-carboxylate reductase